MDEGGRSVDSNRGPLQPGSRFQKWEIRRLLGKGGHAFVYEAHDPFLSLDVAIKIIPSSRDTGRDLVARARSEARVLVRISHPNVVKVMDAGATDDGLVYLVMEKLTGRDLRKVLRQYTRLHPVEALHVAVQAAEAVAAAHAAGAIHRDLKPENVFICPAHLVKVLDFGIAKVMGYGAPTTQKDLLHGTVLYMPPEQLKGFGVTERSDIFSLGTLLYEALHRHPALLGKEVPTVQELGWIQIERMPPLLSKVDPSIPAHVARFVQRAIMKSPDQRYANMAEMAEAARTTLARLKSEIGSKGAPILERDLSVGPPDEPSSPTSPQASNGGAPISATRDTELLTGTVPPPPPVSESPRAAASDSQQLTPPPTISQVAPKPVSVTELLGRELPWRTLAIAGSAVGIGLGVVYALSDVKPNRGPNAVPSEARTHSAMVVPTDTPNPPSVTATAPSDSPTVTETEPPAPSVTPPASPAPLAVAARPSAVAGSAAAPIPVASKAPAPAKSSRSAMDERLDWLEKDLKPTAGKPQASKPPPPKPKKSSGPDFPSIGVGSEP